MSFYKDHYQVVIMGGGLAGMACALRLQKWGINDILIAALRGMGRSTYPTVLTLIFMCGLRVVWVYAFFPLFPEAHALSLLYLVWPIGWIACILFSLPVFFSTKRQLENHYASPIGIQA